MSSTINVFAVRIDRLKQAMGSRDRALIDAVMKSQDNFLCSIDEIDDESEMKCADAVAELVNGEVSKNGAGYLYGYALEALCRELGEELPNMCGIAGASEWLEEIDGHLKKKGVAIQLSTLTYGGSPVPIPEPDDYPFIGQWPAQGIPAALAALKSANLADLDSSTKQTFAEITRWLEAAAKSPGASIVGFLS